MSKLANKNVNTQFPFLFSPLLNLGEFSRKRKGGLPHKMYLGNFVRNLPFSFFFLEIKLKNYSKYPEDTLLLIFYKSFSSFRGLGMTGTTGCRAPYKQQNGGIKTSKWGIKTSKWGDKNIKMGDKNIKKIFVSLKVFDIIKTTKRKEVVYERGNTL